MIYGPSEASGNLLNIFGSFLFFHLSQGRQLQRKKLPVQESRWCHGSHRGSRLGRWGIKRLTTPELLSLWELKSLEDVHLPHLWPFPCVFFW